MSELSPETLALLDRARDGEPMPASHRSAIRRRLAIALGVVAPFAMGTTAAASVSVATWAARGLAILGAAGVVGAVAVAPSPKTALVPDGPSAAHASHVQVPPAPVTGPSRMDATPVARLSVPDSLVAPSTLDAPVPREAPRIPAAAPSIGDHVEAALSRPVVRAPSHPAEYTPSHPAEYAPSHPEAPGEPLEDALATEVRLIDGARAAIDGGDPARALALLDDHDRRFPTGSLAPEAAALRVEALCASGRTTESESAVRRFEARYPGSPLERRFASTCARAAAAAVER
jgi:hypothetical protein